MKTIRMTAEELDAYLRSLFPSADDFGFRVESAAPMEATVRLLYDDRHLRPGETISGPSLMTLADTAMYAAVLAMIGPVPLAVTTNLNINFLRKPAKKDVIGRAQLLKLGRRLAVGSVTMVSEGDPDPVAHATVTYSIPG